MRHSPPRGARHDDCIWATFPCDRLLLPGKQVDLRLHRDLRHRSDPQGSGTLQGSTEIWDIMGIHRDLGHCGDPHGSGTSWGSTRIWDTARTQRSETLWGSREIWDAVGIHRDLRNCGDPHCQNPTIMLSLGAIWQRGRGRQGKAQEQLHYKNLCLNFSRFNRPVPPFFLLLFQF